MVKKNWKKEYETMEENYSDMSRTKRKWENRAYHRGFWLFIIPFLLIGLFLIIYNIRDINVDEDAFCLDKLKTFFPEYKFISADYTEAAIPGGMFSEYIDVCRGYYEDPDAKKLESRDGLKEFSKNNFFIRITK